ncbi:1,4-dihydroxy-6-naphthoate synthase [Seinonella peptonophila]|uniref:1,4-dihydroxy-6-naphtoate synthase n=1 Tax=Seinonella peptonophila TaxID=112248 RepID=A0A1M4Z736_9BACL|nr:1,4-dihydroxy-6-naphthoate synthase [Seinonella peptonophila]SHF13805.1 1,4-dihydroxy-6-naphthoate synthase [Seinonella peptonophila]
MQIAFSPCPNDTFVFHAWVHGRILEASKLDVIYADIDQTNELALQANAPDILKISYAALPWVLSEYALLPCGGALGRGCGPLVLISDKHDPNKEHSRLTGARVAVPSERSTAYLLFRLWAKAEVPSQIEEIVVMPFDQIMPAVQQGTVDAGLVIHEARFTYPRYGLTQLVDLGEWWEKETALPIPLGAIIARRSLDLAAITRWIRASVTYAWEHPTASQAYVLTHAQEMDSQVAQSHIDLYVNSFTHDLGAEGYAAIKTLLNRAADEGLVPAINPNLLANPS